MDQPRHPSPARNTADIPESTSDDHPNRAKRPPPNASTAPGRPRIDQHQPPRSKHRHAEVALRGTRPHDPESDLPAALPGDHQSPPPHRRHPDRTHPHPHPPTPDTPGLPTTPTPDKQRTPSDTKPFTSPHPTTPPSPSPRCPSTPGSTACPIPARTSASTAGIPPTAVRRAPREDVGGTGRRRLLGERALEPC